MMEGLNLWIRNLAVFFILTSTIMNMMPDDRYARYVRFFLGMLLILVVIEPALHILNIQAKLDTSAYYEQTLQEFGMSDGEQLWEKK